MLDWPKKGAVQYKGKQLLKVTMDFIIIIQSFIKTDISTGRESAILQHPTGDLSPTWSVQVMLLESVMEGPLTEQHCTGTYPQIQDPGHCRDHCHSLNKILDRRYYPLPYSTQNSQLPLQQYFVVFKFFLLLLLKVFCLPPAGCNCYTTKVKSKGQLR